MRQTRVGLADEFLVIAAVFVVAVKLQLSNAGTGVEAGTLAERIFVTSRTTEVGSIDIFEFTPSIVSSGTIVVTFNLAVDVVNANRQVPFMTGTIVPTCTP